MNSWYSDWLISIPFIKKIVSLHRHNTEIKRNDYDYGTETSTTTR